MNVRLHLKVFQKTKRAHPAKPQTVTGVINSDGSIKVDWKSVKDAQSYLTHYGAANQSDPKKATFMGYSETNSWTLKTLDVPVLEAGDKIYIYVQAYKEKGIGADDVAKAKYLHDGEFTGSDWSEPVVLTAE